jgi:hypothetical protein
MGNALRKDVAVFHQVPAKSVDALSALTHQEIAGSEHDAVCLLTRPVVRAGTASIATSHESCRSIALATAKGWFERQRRGLDGGSPIPEAIVTRQGGDGPRQGGKGAGSACAACRARPERSEGDAQKLGLSSEIKIQIWMADWPLHSLGRYRSTGTGLSSAALAKEDGIGIRGGSIAGGLLEWTDRCRNAAASGAV